MDIFDNVCYNCTITDRTAIKQKGGIPVTIEALQKRIEGKEKALEKLNKKMERILKAKESGWENNPYYYHEDDIRYTQRDIDEAEQALAKYKADLAKETEKANSRNIPVS